MSTPKKYYGATHYQLWDNTELKQQLDSDMYQGAQFDPLSGHLHPLNYTLGVADAAAKAGAQIFEHSPMIRIEPYQTVGWFTLRKAVSNVKMRYMPSILMPV